MLAQPAMDAHLHRQHIADRRGRAALEHPRQTGAQFRIFQLGIARVHIGGQRAFLRQVMPEVFIGGNGVAFVQPQRGGHRRDQGACIVHGGIVIGFFRRDAVGGLPQRHAIGAPVKAEGPARQAFARIPFALAVMQQAAGREPVAQPADQRIGQRALVRADGGDVPFRMGAVVNRNKGRLAAHGQAHVMHGQDAVHRIAQLLDLVPLLRRIGLGDARRLLDARHAHVEVEQHFGRLDGAADGRGLGRIGGAGQRDMAFAGEQAAGGIKPHPAGARQIDLAPGMQVGEIHVGARRAVQRFHIGLELDEITAGKARRQTQMAQQLDQKPGRVAAGAGLLGQRLLRRLDAGLHADGIADFARQGRIEVEYEIGGLPFLARYARQISVEFLAQRLGLQVGLKLRLQFGRIGEGIFLGLRLQEEVEGVDDFHVHGEVHRHREVVHFFREHHPRQPVGLRVLLPVDEVAGRLDRQAIGRDLGAGVRRGAQANGLGPQRNGPVIAVAGDVAECCLNAHRGSL